MQNKSILEDQDVDQNSAGFAPNQDKILFLEERIKNLGDICNELNPYQAISPEFQKRLREFNIIEANDPFHVTNALLRLLEDAIHELHVLKPLSEEEMRIENLR